MNRDQYLLRSKADQIEPENPESKNEETEEISSQEIQSPTSSSSFQPNVRSTLIPDLINTSEPYNKDTIKIHSDIFVSCSKSADSIIGDVDDSINNSSPKTEISHSTDSIPEKYEDWLKSLAVADPFLLTPRVISIDSSNFEDNNSIETSDNKTVSNEEINSLTQELRTTLLTIVDKATAETIMPNTDNENTNATENANVTVSQAVQGKHTPILPKFEHPKKFNPAFEDAVQFLKHFEARTNSNRWTDSHKLAYFGSYLEGYAYDWYVKYLSDDKNANKLWKDVKQDFLSEYTPENPTSDLRRSLAQRKQRVTEDIRQYFYNILELCGEIDPNMSTDLIRDHFENGLHESYKDQFVILAAPLMTLQELKSVVHKLHKIHLRAIQKEANHQASNLLTIQPKNKNWNQNSFNGNQTQYRPNGFNYLNQTQTTRQYPINFTKNREFIPTRTYYPQGNTQNRQPFRYQQNFRQGQNQNYTSTNNFRRQGEIMANRPQTFASQGSRQPQNNYNPVRTGQTNQSFPNTRSRAGTIICWNCNKVGHHLRNCDQPITNSNNNRQNNTGNSQNNISNNGRNYNNTQTTRGVARVHRRPSYKQ